MDQTMLDNLLNQLIKLGENKEEMEHWRNLYPFMSEEEKSKLDANLIKTLEVRKN
jgi:hypothetical protein